MTIVEMFVQFINNLAIDNQEQISNRYGEITSCLNKKYRDTDSKTANSLKVGSYGRFTAIKGISDLDMIYMMPQSQWDRFKNNGQSALLQEVKNTIKDRYSRTQAWGDGQVVVVSFDNQEVEVLPAFEQEDGSFKYPNTNNGGSWPVTRPRSEIKAISDLDNQKNKNLRRLCKMIRAWKNKRNVVMSGILIDTLAYKFLNSTNDYDDKSFLNYDCMVRDFFKYISELPKQEYFLAPGSNQRVNVKKNFQKKAKKAYNLCLEAIAADGQSGVNGKWKKIFGRPFPAPVATTEKAPLNENITWRNTEEFIEDQFPIDIRYSLKIDCEVSQNGYREHTLRHMLFRKIPLLAKKKLSFRVTYIDVPKPFEIAWKVLNRGEIARKRDDIRGQIVWDTGSQAKRENTKFRGPHLVECYVVKNGVVVAKDRIDVPIQTGE